MQSRAGASANCLAEKVGDALTGKESSFQSVMCLKVLIEYFHSTWRDQKGLIMSILQSQEQESWEALNGVGCDGRFHGVQI